MQQQPKPLSTDQVGKTLAQVRARYAEADKGIRRRADSWRMRLAALRGGTWQTKSGAGSGAIGADEDEVRVSLNRIRGLVRAATNQVVKNVPDPSVPPASNETSALAKAAASEQLLHSTLIRRRAKIVAVEAKHWANTCGIGFVKFWWNPRIGNRAETPVYDMQKAFGPKPEVKGDDAELRAGAADAITRPDDLPGALSAVRSQFLGDAAEAQEEMQPTLTPPLDEFGEPLLNEEFDGDVQYDFVDSFSLLRDPTAARWGEVRWVIHRRPFARQELLEMYPTDVLGQPSKDKLTVQQPEAISRMQTDDVYGESTNQYTTMPELCEYWEAPSTKYQHGRLIQWCGEALLHYGPIPYRPARLPFYPVLGENMVPGTADPDGMVHDILPAQKVHNYFASKATEWVRTILNPPLLNPEQGEIDDAQMSDKFGNILTYTHPYKPEWMNVPDIPASVPALLNLLASEMQTISGVSPLAFGDTPVGAESGRSMALLGEKDAAFRFADHLHYAEFWRELCAQTLMLMHQFYEEGRLVRVLGRNARWETIAFRRSDFSTSFDVEIEPFGPEHNTTTRDSKLTDAFERGILGDRGDPAVQASVRRAMNLDHAGRMPYDDKELDRANARAEQLAFLNYEVTGIPPPTDPDDMMVDDQEVFVEEGDRFRKTDEFRRLPPALKQEFVARMTARQQILAQQNAVLSGQMGAGAEPAGRAGTPAKPEGLVGNPGGGGGGLTNDAQPLSPTEAAAGHELAADVSHVQQRAAAAMGVPANGA